MTLEEIFHSFLLASNTGNLNLLLMCIDTQHVTAGDRVFAHYSTLTYSYQSKCFDLTNQISKNYIQII
jgi:hypothetical protein